MSSVGVASSLEMSGERQDQQQRALTRTVAGPCKTQVIHLLEDAVQLIDFGVALKQRPAGNHLGKDAAHAPDVYWSGIELAAQQNLGRAVPQSDHLVSVSAHRYAKRSC